MARTQVQTELIATNAISGTIIADNAITATHIAQNSISGILIPDSGITTTMIAANNVTAAKIVTGAVANRHLASTVISSQSAVTAASGDYVLIGDTSDSNNLKKALVSDFGETDRLPLAGGTMTGDLTLRGYNGPVITLGSSSGNDPRIDFEDQNATSHAGSLFYDQDADTIRLLRTVSGSAVDGIAIDASGEVGIGTATPSSLLHVKGTSAHTYLTIEANSGVGNAIKFIGANTWVVGNDTAGGTPDTAFSISDGNDERLTILSDGKVGIGTTSPGDVLELDGTNPILKIGNRIRIKADESNADAWFGIGSSLNTFKFGDADFGTSFLTIKSATGDVGIGTASPNAYSGYTTLTIDSPSNGSGSVLDLEYRGTRHLSIYSESASSDINVVTNHPLLFRTNNTERMRIDTGGNIGMTIVPEAWNTDFRVIQMGTGGSSVFGGATSNRNVGLGQNSYLGTDGSWKYTQADHAGLLTGYDGTWEIDVAGSGSADANISWTTAVKIDNSGKVGIGTTSPSSYSGYADDFVIKEADNGHTGMTIASGTSHYGSIRWADGTSDPADSQGIIDYNHGANEFRFFTANGERMRLSSAGKLQIGGTDDQALLNVTQSDNSYTGYFRNTHGSAPYGIKIEYTGSSPNSNSGTWFLYAEDTTEAKAKLRSNGYFYLAGTAYGSDRDLKENIVDTPDSLAKLKQIRVRDFNLKGQSEKHTGVIAQEIETLFPDLLGEEVISKEDAEVEKKIKTVEYNGLIGILVKSVQELEARLAALE